MQTKSARKIRRILFAQVRTERYVQAMKTAPSQARAVNAIHSSLVDSRLEPAFCSPNFGECLYEMRQKLGLSQAALAEKAAISTGYLSELENCRRNPPKPRVTNQLALALGLNREERDYLLCLAAAGRLKKAEAPVQPKIALLLETLQASASTLPEATIDRLIQTLKEPSM